jgi:hypothetical protein
LYDGTNATLREGLEKICALGLNICLDLLWDKICISCAEVVPINLKISSERAQNFLNLSIENKGT